jgi:hypothetical protein
VRGNPSGCDLRLQPLGCGFVSALVEVAIDVEHCLYRRVSQAVGDDLGVFALGDQQSHLRASEGVGTEVLVEAGCFECRFPDTAHPRGSSDRSALRCWEEPRLRIRVLESGDALDDLVGDGPR